MNTTSLTKWMSLLLVVHLLVPSIHYFGSTPSLVLSWFGFDWYAAEGWVVFIQYAFVGVPAFVFIGLATILPLLLLGFLLLGPRRSARDHAIICLGLGSLLLAVYLNGWFFYTWPIPYQPVQTISIALLTLLAFRYWRQSHRQITAN
ncbi:MAG: hypothetical protein ABSF63_05280 [Candidatus Bathyarchaeia archaeon]